MASKNSLQQIEPDHPLIPSNYSRLIARELGLQIRELPAYLKLTNLSIEKFLRDDTLLTVQQQLQLLGNALAITDDEAFGLSMGRHFTPETHGAMGLLVNSSPNLKMMLKALQVFLPTRLYFARVELVENDQWLDFILRLDLDTSEEIERLLSEMLAMSFAQNTQFVIGRPANEIEFLFAFDAPAYSDRYIEYLPGLVKFSQPVPIFTARIPLSLCEEPNAAANAEYYALAYKQCESILAQLHEHKGTWKYRIAEMMLSSPSSVVSDESAAQALFISKRTLARKLRREKTSFREIRDDILAQQAGRYLRDTDMSVEAIAAMLNYHDSSNFRRAFKRWFKMTPQQYRQ